MDVYVIFGAAVRPDGSPSGTLQRRTEGAWAFAKQHGSKPLFILSGALGDYPPSEAEAMRCLLTEKGVPEESIIKDEASTDTLESALNCSEIIRSLDRFDNLYVCTSPYHSWRCQLLFRLNKLPFLRAKMPGDLESIGLQKWLFYCFRESIAIPWDALLISIHRLQNKN